jgi:hypothetical protein
LVSLPSDPVTRAAFARRQHVTYDEKRGLSADFATAEDILTAKLHTFQQTGSEKHLRDARGIPVTQWGRLDLGSIHRWARASGMEDTWLALQEIARQETAGDEAAVNPSQG